ncbi:hypothetical protein KOR34_15190 [Posidoniimonas corsicana]|uniref:Gfo/Idh/MocA-like oxidoreductase bacterial type C-terminal domain-containing protein n=1 Tax=Posidoniimonas corsicana TaxID=1938618 RepID=A0A5C5VF08_9BACT|nr:hypothetical protein [Posidoniimonas corsicana]TWT36613.1 hypothetical protein KOR34_15190 [Posidoniimonas corsicana]
MYITSRGDNGILFEGEKGRLFVNWGDIAGKPIEEGWDNGTYSDDDLRVLYKGNPHEGHKDDSYRCVREVALPVSDVFSHVQTMNSCHLSSTAARLGRRIEWDPVSAQIVGDDQSAALVARKSLPGFSIANT